MLEKLKILFKINFKRILNYICLHRWYGLYVPPTVTYYIIFSFYFLYFLYFYEYTPVLLIIINTSVNERASDEEIMIKLLFNILLLTHHITSIFPT